MKTIVLTAIKTNATDEEADRANELQEYFRSLGYEVILKVT